MTIPTQTPTYGPRAWKLFFCAVLLMCATICAAAIVNWQQVLKPGMAGTLGVETTYLRGNGVKIDKIDPGSPLAAFGLKKGDAVAFDRISDGARFVFGTDEQIGMTVGSGDARRHVTVQPVARSRVDRDTAVGYVLVTINSLAALMLAGLIGLRRAASPSARLLALVLLIETSFAAQFMSGGALMSFARQVLAPLVSLVAFCGFLMFSARFPNDASSHVPGWVRRASLPLIVCFVAYGILVSAHRYEWLTLGPAWQFAMPVFAVLFVLFSGVNLWRAFRQSTGAERQRVQWVGIAISVRFALLALQTIPGLAFVATTEYTEVQIVVTILANFALAYGILRHRVFDVGLAVNRALVYGIVSLVLLVSFGLLEWTAHHFVSFEEAEKNTLVDAGIALGLYLVFHRLRHSVEHFVERLFFHKWHANEERLRRFVKQAAHVTAPPALVDATLTALQNFSGDAGAALYRLENGRYVLAVSTGLAAPQTAGIDDPVAVALRTDQAASVPADCASALPGALALPMTLRGELQGFILLGQKPNGGAYRPDEIAVLEFAAHQVGLDLQALRSDQLEAQVRELEQKLASYVRAFELNGAGRQAGAVAAVS
jgi:hypothetical protein